MRDCSQWRARSDLVWSGLVWSSVRVRVKGVNSKREGENVTVKGSMLGLGES